ncbi:HET-domain-containing protein [Stipitochalara longipes BDJ]|nr:HET-domain-containing protein [Stipitochalara longipes BDJ]
MFSGIYFGLGANRHEIRILKLLPGRWSDIIQCQMSHVVLDENPDYAALSYVWGDPLLTHEILVNGILYSITTNLYLALRRLRRVDAACIIWVDAVCINQADIEEKTQQVSIMGEIYKTSREVLIWLGDCTKPVALPSIVWHSDDRDSDKLAEYFQTDLVNVHGVLRNDCSEMTDVYAALIFLRLIVDGAHLYDLAFFQRSGEYKLQSITKWEQAMKGLEMILNSPWWNRVWVLQETVLPQRATIQFGNITFPWQMIAQATEQLAHHYTFCCSGHLNTRPFREEEILTGFRKVVDPIELLRNGRADGMRTSLSQLLSITLQRASTDSRDKVYALLSLVTNWYGREPIRPDYALSVNQIYAQVVIKEIQGSNSLQILQGVPWISNTRLPSWITRTSSNHLRNVQESRINASALFRASRDSLCDVQEVAESSVLGVLGLSESDTVLRVSPLIYGESPETSSYTAMEATISSWRKLAGLEEMPNRPYPTGDNWGNVFWRAIANDAVDESESEPKTVSKGDTDRAFRTTWRRLVCEDIDVYEAWWLRTKAAAAFDGPDGTPLPGRSLWAQIPEYKRIIYDRAVQMATVQRKFFITRKGFMGIGPPATSSGDRIVVLFGGDVPFLLREHVNSTATGIPPEEPNPLWKLIGDCYLHGIMDGEAMHQTKGDCTRYYLH